MNKKQTRKILQWTPIILMLLLIGHIITAIILPYFIFPGFLFPHEIEQTDKLLSISEELRSENKHETLRNVYDYVNKTYSSEGYNLYIQIPKHFYKSADKLAGKPQFLPCQLQSLMIKTLLLNTGQFSEEDFKEIIIVSKRLTIHKYYEISVEETTYHIDSFWDIFEVIDK